MRSGRFRQIMVCDLLLIFRVTVVAARTRGAIMAKFKAAAGLRTIFGCYSPSSSVTS